jgi:hypothetical protein
MDLDLNNKEFQLAFNMLKKTNQTFFLTGKAGTGKSTFLNYFVKNVKKNFVVVAPTGIAAVNIRGVTIHSFFGFPLRPLLHDDACIKGAKKGSPKSKVITAMDTLIIDEVSMARADLIDGIDCYLRRSCGDSQLPFGGKQVLFIGDIFQLKPITNFTADEVRIFNEFYDSPYFYQAKVFESLQLPCIELRKVYRQSDPVFIDLLDKIRVNEVTQADLNQINRRVISGNNPWIQDFAITLTTTNAMANDVNTARLSSLEAEPFTFTAHITGEFESSKYSTDTELILKEGAQVVFIKNDADKKWVNGTIGKVCSLTQSRVKVKLIDGTIYTINTVTWENIQYHYDPASKNIKEEVIGTFIQYPLKLAWAITIHKSQGLTFERVIVDLGRGAFASGQAYVALSRATSLAGLFLKKGIRLTDIFIDKEIRDFATTFNNLALIEEMRSMVGKRQNPTLLSSHQLDTFRFSDS